jgi:hypothetical protein
VRRPRASRSSPAPPPPSPASSPNSSTRSPAIPPPRPPTRTPPGPWPRPWDVVEDELRDAASSRIQWRRMRRAHRPARHPRRSLRGRERPLHNGLTWWCRWVPQNRGWRRDSLYRGDGEGVLVNNGEKKGRLWGSAGEGFIPCMTIFRDREAAEVALRPCTARLLRPSAERHVCKKHPVPQSSVVARRRAQRR